jgi:hypothetical protein
MMAYSFRASGIYSEWGDSGTTDTLCPKISSGRKFKDLLSLNFQIKLTSNNLSLKISLKLFVRKGMNF